MKKELREILNVPKEERIAQFIMNRCSDYDHQVSINTYCDGKFTDDTFAGIDIFHVEDDEFIRLMQEKDD